MSIVSEISPSAQVDPPCPLNLEGSSLVQAYCRKTPGSSTLANRARQIFPGGITHDARYIEPHGIYVTHAEGSRKWDVDGNEYIDYSGGHGALILGHNHPLISDAVRDQLGKGTHYGAGHELEIEWGGIIKDMVPCAERVRFTNSGTESTMLALRLARAHTGRSKFLRFKGHFHGWHDYVTGGVTSHFDGSPITGVPSGTSATMVIAPPNDLQATADILSRDEDIAAIILEPTGSTWGKVPIMPSFLVGLRRLADEFGVTLIFDEVVSGFRCSPGGAQEAYGVTPDLTTLGKIVSGGLPGAALVGKKEYLDLIDFRQTAMDGRERISHKGTFNAAPVSGAAGIAALNLVRSGGPCAEAIGYGNRLIDQLNAMFSTESVNWVAYGTFGGFHVFLNPQAKSTDRKEIESGEFGAENISASKDPSFVMKVRIGALLHGVDLQGWPGGPVSAAHNDDDLERTVDSFRQTIRLLRSDGDID